MKELSKLLASLNSKQLEAVKAIEGYIRVIAGAGTGKTRVLTTRFTYIIKHLGINASNILCVTFTNKAANEMKTRVKNIIGQNTSVKLITTYHGFCVQVLREDITKIHYPKGFIIMDVEDQKTLLRNIYDELNLTVRDYTFKQALEHIKKQKKSLDYFNHTISGNVDLNTDILDQIFWKYLAKQQRNYSLDFDDLMNFTIHIFNNYPDVLVKWQQRLHYILVDEMQDSSQKQFLLIEMLSKHHKNLFVVGDPDQTIYEWRGAKPEILVDFDKKYPTCKTIILNQNYRSTKTILKASNQIIAHNKIRVHKELFTTNENGEKLTHFHAKNEISEGNYVATEIKSIVNNTEYSDIAILYRASFISRSIEQALIRENIPYTVFGGIRFFERREIKDVLAYLRLLEFGDDLSFLRVINAPKRGLGKKFIEHLTKLALAQGKTLLITLKLNIKDRLLNRPGAIEFLQLIKTFEGLKGTTSISDLIKIILDKTGLTNEIRKDGDEERLDNIKELLNSIILLETESDDEFNLINYLQEIALYTDMDTKDLSKKQVKLMTIHTAKGLEFPYVFLCGFNEGVIPNLKAIEERKQRAIEEERRLVYVAITRAEKKFYFTESEGYNYNTGMLKYPSRFLFEIDESTFEKVGDLTQEFIAEAKSQLNSSFNNSNTPVRKLEVGDTVFHPFWGDGKIIELDKRKEVYNVEFIASKKTKPINIEFDGLVLLKKLANKLHNDC